MAIQQKRNKHIEDKINEYNKYNFKDDNLWNAFKDEFAHLNVENFRQAIVPLQRALRSHLRASGVWIGWDRKTTVPESLFELLEEEEPAKWTLKEIASLMKRCI